MKKIVVRDLPEKMELSREAIKRVCGGGGSSSRDLREKPEVIIRPQDEYGIIVYVPWIGPIDD